MATLGFEEYIEPLKVYLQKYRESVRQDSKQRFSLLEEDGELLIWANQGQTVVVCFLLDPPDH